jgi:DNA mismatch repair protein MutS
MTIVKDYLDYTEKWKKEYGERTLVLIQVGSFFESYGLLDTDNNIYGSSIVEFAEINDMTISRKNICVGKARVVMAGFGLPQLEKYIKKLQDHGFTIPVYTQDTQSKNTTRSLHTIFSPGTYFSNDTKELSNNITCIWIHHSKSGLSISEQVTIGISNIDIYTGKTSIFEFSKDFIHNPSTYDELERYISIYHPNECIIIANFEENIINDIINFTSINSIKIHKINITSNTNTDTIKLVKNAEKQNYQQEVIKRFYLNKNDETILNGLQNYCIAIQSFIYLLDFTYKHNPNLVNNISEPLLENYTNRLILANHSLKQLNIIPDHRFSGKYSCVSNLLNNCVTPMGKRNFLYNLLNPTTNIETLNQSYYITDHLLQGNTWENYRLALSNIRDMEKLRRKLIMKKITPKDFTILHNNICIIISLYSECNKDKRLMKYLARDEKVKDEMKELLVFCKKLKEMIERHLDINKSKIIDDISQEKLGNWDTHNIFYINRGLDERVDLSYKKTIECSQELECIRKYLSDLISKHEKSTKTTEFVKIHETAKMDATLQATKRRVTFLKKAIENTATDGGATLKYKSSFSEKEETYMLDLTTLDYSVNGGSQSSMVITSPQIRKITSLINTSKNDLIGELELYYYKFVDKFLENDLESIINFVINLDILQCKCFIAKEHNYCKPIIQPYEKSFINFKGIRHALIEHLNTREIYITNDLSLGYDINGILLYGTNAVGKTSFIKAIGIAIIMAQAGLYVPATEFIYYPYTTLFTRILGNDNIFKGLSTFAVEMTELRTILQMADKNSLILGDELCSGTESDSALSIFVAGLEILHNKLSTFLFATHFHEIVKYEEVIALDKMKMYHMSVIFDKANNKLVYDRKLKAGAGESMYGLEVCKSLNLPLDFLNRAHDLRIKYNKCYKNILAQEVSKYNSKKIKDICEICNINNGTEIHHLEYQKNAQDNYIITGNVNFHKNHAANLINVCHQCHYKIHKNNEKLSIRKTTDGYEVSTPV